LFQQNRQIAAGREKQQSARSRVSAAPLTTAAPAARQRLRDKSLTGQHAPKTAVDLLAVIWDVD
ncbi:hypothetical protein, partial [Pseudomonas savastanoi]|uniref:hypothetical protein n=1 Tax=Pseudomonas savastanoi TaxID=29438 RepID=UPI001C8219DE